VAAWALALSVIALALAVAHWALDWARGDLPFRPRRERREPVQLRVELLARSTNCFLIRGGYTLVLVSLRLYNDTSQRAATIARLALEARLGRRWKRLDVYPAEEAVIFKSLVRNALPATIPASGAEDFYEIYQLPDLVARTTLRIRIRVTEQFGLSASIEDDLPIRLDTRPPLDVLFQMLDV
jgi:hypothetical protein